MIKEIIDDFSEMFNKYYKRILNKYPKKEFYKFIEKSEYLRNENTKDIFNKIITIINERDINNYKSINITKADSYTNKIDGVNTLKKIRNKIVHSIPNDDYDEELKTELYYYYFVLVVILNLKPAELKIETLDSYINMSHSFKNRKSIYFRGQSNSSWELSQSSLRNINRKTTQIYTYDKVVEDYEKNDLIKRYNEVINNNGNKYEMISFLQHSISYSPFIDFTSNFYVATIFALSNSTSINDFYNQDSAIYILENNNENLEKLEIDNKKIKGIKIGIYNDNIIGLQDYLYMYQEMGSIIKPKADTFLDVRKTNDRMRYQSGLFALFTNYIITDINNVSQTIQSGYGIIKVIIDKDVKREILDWLNANKKIYNIRYLMNPYIIFNEII